MKDWEWLLVGVCMATIFSAYIFVFYIFFNTGAVLGVALAIFMMIGSFAHTLKTGAWSGHSIN